LQIEPYRWRISPSLVAHLWKAVTRQYHAALRPVLARCIPRDGVVLDVGAHAGQFTKLFARLAADGQVLAIEPGSYARAILRVAIWTHRLRNVAVVPAALGAEPGIAWLNIPVKASGALGFGLSHLGAAEARWARVATEIVTQTTVDQLAAALALDRLDFIKADIEGGELRLLMGARQSLVRYRPRLLIELNGAHLARAGDTLDAAFTFLGELGYSAFAFGPGGTLVPVSSVRDGDFWFFPADDPLVVSLRG
jgi:FkbM family methyltransferase